MREISAASRPITEQHILLSLAVWSDTPAVIGARDDLHKHVRKLTPRLMHSARGTEGKEALSRLLVLTKLAHGDMIAPIRERIRRRWVEDELSREMALAIRMQVDTEIIEKLSGVLKGNHRGNV